MKRGRARSGDSIARQRRDVMTAEDTSPLNSSSLDDVTPRLRRKYEWDTVAWKPVTTPRRSSSYARGGKICERSR